LAVVTVFGLGSFRGVDGVGGGGCGGHGIGGGGRVRAGSASAGEAAADAGYLQRFPAGLQVLGVLLRADEQVLRGAEALLDAVDVGG